MRLISLVGRNKVCFGRGWDPFTVRAKKTKNKEAYSPTLSIPFLMHSQENSSLFCTVSTVLAKQKYFYFQLSLSMLAFIAGWFPVSTRAWCKLISQNHCFSKCVFTFDIFSEAFQSLQKRHSP